MSKIKKVNWDKCNSRGITGSNVYEDISEKLEKGMTITAKFKGKDINMKIIAEISPSVFEAEIFDIEPNAATHEGLSLDDIVEVKRDDICWHQK